MYISEMTHFGKITLALVCLGWLWLQKMMVVEYIFHYGCQLLPQSPDFTESQIIGTIFLNLIDFVICLAACYLIEQPSARYWQRFFLYAIVISPVMLELSDVFHDKSCVKAWQHLSKIWWYALVQLPVWAFVVNRGWAYRRWFNRFDFVLFALVFIGYHFIKKY